jgi:hypothetical protein
MDTKDTTAQDQTPRDSASLYIAIAGMACLAACFVIITFTVFLRSSAYETVQAIQANSKIDGSSLGDYDTTSPVKTADIDETIRGIENKMNSLDNIENYGPDAVSDTSIGLEH